MHTPASLNQTVHWFRRTRQDCVAFDGCASVCVHTTTSSTSRSEERGALQEAGQLQQLTRTVRRTSSVCSVSSVNEM